MKKTLLSLFIFASAAATFAQKDIYYYYDANWKGVQSKEACTFYRVVKDTKPVDSKKKQVVTESGPKQYKDYYASGELAAEGNYISIDADNARKSVYDGKCIKYYKNGNVADSYFFEGGKSNGERIRYYENGNIKERYIAENGRVDGILCSFSEDQKYCTQHRFELGQMVDDYYTVSTKDGLCSRYFAITKKPYLETPSPADMHDKKIGEQIWSTIEKNGLSVSMNPYKVKKNGKSLRVEINIANSSLENISFNSNDIQIQYIYRDRDFRDIGMNSLQSGNANIDTYRPYTMEEYAKKSKTIVDASTETYSISAALAKATKTFDTDAQFQNDILASNHVQDYTYVFNPQPELAYRTYFNSITIPSMQSACGRIEIPYERNFDVLRIIIPLNNIPYTFEWERNK